MNLFCWRSVCSVGGSAAEEDGEGEDEEGEVKCKGEKPWSGEGDLIVGWYAVVVEGEEEDGDASLTC